MPAKLIASAVEPMVRAIIGSVTELLADIPPNLAEDVFRGKIRLAGGGSMLPGLAYRIEAAADIPVAVVEDPLRCVIRGAALILENGDAAPSTRPALAGAVSHPGDPPFPEISGLAAISREVTSSAYGAINAVLVCSRLSMPKFLVCVQSAMCKMHKWQRRDQERSWLWRWRLPGS